MRLLGPCKHLKSRRVFVPCGLLYCGYFLPINLKDSPVPSISSTVTLSTLSWSLLPSTFPTHTTCHRPYLFYNHPLYPVFLSIFFIHISISCIFPLFSTPHLLYILKVLTYQHSILPHIGMY